MSPFQTSLVFSGLFVFPSTHKADALNVIGAKNVGHIPIRGGRGGGGGGGQM